MNTIDEITKIIELDIEKFRDISAEATVAAVQNFLYGDGKLHIEEFNSKFSGQETPELMNILYKVGTKELEEEALRTRLELYSLGNYSELVRDMLVGDSKKAKASVDRRIELSNKLYCIDKAQRDIKDLLIKELKAYYKF